MQKDIKSLDDFEYGKAVVLNKTFKPHQKEVMNFLYNMALEEYKKDNSKDLVTIILTKEIVNEISNSQYSLFKILKELYDIHIIYAMVNEENKIKPQGKTNIINSYFISVCGKGHIININTSAIKLLESNSYLIEEIL